MDCEQLRRTESCLVPPTSRKIQRSNFERGDLFGISGKFYLTILRLETENFVSLMFFNPDKESNSAHEKPPHYFSHGVKNMSEFFPEGLTPFAFQVDAFQFAVKALKENRSCYLALDPGLGKTIIAAMIANEFFLETVYYVCPPFLTTNTEEEFSKWCFLKTLVPISDTMIWRETTLEKVKEQIKRYGGILIVDEAHRFKNDRAKRTKALFREIFPLFGKAVFMSGTPMPNSRPIELWPVLRYAAPEIFGRKVIDFGTRYCGGRYTTYWGWDFSRFTNREEFKKKITKYFMYRLKKDVLNLPPKIEGLLTVGEGIPPIISKIEKKILAHYSPQDLIAGKIAKAQDKDDLHLATYLKLLGEYKLKYVLPYIEALLEETNESFLIFAIHKDVIAALEKALSKYNPFVITGSTPKEKRLPMVKKFQDGESRVFIGNIQACGVGFTLTKATRVLFIEFSWVEGENSQGADRTHRIGQNQSVLVQYVVLKDSFDRIRMETLLKKRGLSI